MRYKTFFPLCAAALTAAIVAPAQAKPIPPALHVRYDALIASIKKVDLKTYDSFYAPEYVSVDPKGKATKRAEYLAGIRDLMKDATSASVDIKYKGARTHKSGVVDVAFDVNIHIQVPGGSKNIHEVGVDSWKKIGGAWMEVKTVDKVMQMSAVL